MAKSFCGHPDPKQKPQGFIFSVKGDHASVRGVHELSDVVRKTEAVIGVRISLDDPSKPMRIEAADIGSYTSAFNGAKFPRPQLTAIEQLMAGVAIERPSGNVVGVETFKKAPKATVRKDAKLKHLDI